MMPKLNRVQGGMERDGQVGQEYDGIPQIGSYVIYKGMPHRVIPVNADKGYAYKPVSQAEYDSSQATEGDEVDLESRLNDLLMTKHAAANIITEVDADIEAVQQRLIEQEEAKQAVLVAEEAKKAREALARYAGGGPIRPRYELQLGSPTTDSSELLNVPPKSKRKKIIGAAALLLVAGVGGAGSYVISDGWRNVPFAASFGNEPAGEESVLSIENLDLGNCATDDNGKATPALTGEVVIQADVLWPFKLSNGQDAIINIADETNTESTRNPNIQISAESKLYACVPESDKSGFLQVQGNVITADLSKVSPQIEIGENVAPDPIEPFKLSEQKDAAGIVVVTNEAATAAVAASKDPANISFLLKTTTAHAGAMLASPDGATAPAVKEAFENIKPHIIADLKAQAAALGHDEVTVELKGEYKSAISYIGEAPTTSDKVSIDPKTITIQPVFK